jgi:predicted DNA-binding protein
MKRTNIYFTDEMLARLKKATEKTGMSMAEFVRRAIEEALKRMKL